MFCKAGADRRRLRIISLLLRMMRFALIFFGVAVFMIAFCYLYPAHIFEAEVAGQGSSLVTELSLRSILFKENLPETVNAKNVESVRPTMAGIMIMIVCFIGLPAMIAWRFALRSKPADKSSAE